MIDLQTKIIRIADILSSPVRDELVMFNVTEGKYFALNEIAAAIWQRLDSPVTVEALCSDLVEVFDVSPEQCRAETLAFVSKLEAKGLIQTVGSDR